MAFDQARYYREVVKPRRQAASTHRRQAVLGPDAKDVRIRMPGPLYEQLRTQAVENRRSVNAEIVASLSGA